MDDANIIDRLDQLIDIFSKFGGGAGASDFSTVMGRNIDAASKQQKIVEILTKRLTDVDKQLLKNKKSMVQLGSTFEEFDEMLDELTDSAEKLDLQEKRAALAAQYMASQFKIAGSDLAKATAGTVVKGLVKSTGDMVSKLQSGSSGIETATGLMTGAVDIVQTSFGAVSSAGNAVGQTLSASTNPRMKALGVATSAVSSAFGSLTEGASALAKFGIEILSKEVDKTVKAFNNTISAGAAFGRGMDDIRNYATAAGLSVEDFSQVIKNNSGLLAESGYTVADAAKIVSGITAQFATQTGKSGLTLRREMLNLGYSFQEQAELTAQVVADMKKTGTGGMRRDAVAQITADLARDMRKVADIMGEEYKQRMDNAKRMSEQYTFFNKVMQRARETNDPTLLKRIQAAFATMSEAEVRARMQYTVTGGAVTDLAANIVGAADGAADFDKVIFHQVNPSLEDLTRGSNKLHQSYLDGSNQTLMAVGTATAAIGAYSDITAASTELQQLSFKANEENMRKSAVAVDALAGAQGGLQDGVMGAEDAAQKLKIALQDVLTPAIVQYAKVSKEILSTLQDQIAQITGKEGGSSTNWGKVGARSLEYGTTGAMIGTMIAPGVGTAIGGAIGAVAGGALGYAGYADGGVASGPVSGYQATLHGTEAVVPLPDGDTIPVKVQESSQASAQVAEAIKDSITQAMMPQTRMLTDILDTLRDGNKNTAGILNNTY